MVQETGGGCGGRNRQGERVVPTQAGTHTVFPELGGFLGFSMGPRLRGDDVQWRGDVQLRGRCAVAGSYGINARLPARLAFTSFSARSTAARRAGSAGWLAA
jgi:hypothetical protein